ncbi:hsp70 family protein [Anaeramoeba flamelloides]|uniref:Hsp70 family protein n=1 Tax=Anaeramoeba flamelloides TaxID=1746091 RepID=A0AAV8A862_9EUKA|nr:hsp70 family protein [Anaeramoeba flamelloides]
MSYNFIIAIDLGTNRSGFAYGIMQDERNRVFGESRWGDLKTSSAILLTKNQAGDYYDDSELIEVVSFGDEALDDYSSLLEEGDEEELSLYELFQDYKTAFYTGNSFIKSHSGRVFKLTDVVSWTLRWLKQLAMEHLNSIVRKNVTNEEIKWVIPVPAIWSQETKLIMVTCAYRAEMIDDIESKQLVILNDTEAAALYGFVDPDPIIPKKNFKNGKIIILDCGYEKIDLSVVEISRKYEKKGNIKVLMTGDGERLGSHLIDNEFKKFLKAFTQNENVESCPEYLFVFQQWIKEKHLINFSYKEDPLKVKFVIPESLSSKNKNVKQLIKIWNKNKTPTELDYLHPGTTDKGIILLKKGFLLSFTEKCVEKVTNYLQLLFRKKKKNFKGVNTMFLVGNYAKSPILQKNIIDKFTSNKSKYNLKILVSQNPGKAILQGAVKFGKNPTSIVSRAYGFNLGLHLYPAFNPNIHKESKKVEINGKYFCKDVFKPLVKKDVPINVDWVKPQTFSALNRDLTIEIYTSPKDLEEGEVYYIDDPDFSIFGSTIITNIQKDNEKPVQITLEFRFGGSMIKITAVNKKTGEKFPAIIRYGEKEN